MPTVLLADGRLAGTLFYSDKGKPPDGDRWSHHPLRIPLKERKLRVARWKQVWNASYYSGLRKCCGFFRTDGEIDCCCVNFGWHFARLVPRFGFANWSSRLVTYVMACGVR